jgi:hypothetical protein
MRGEQQISNRILNEAQIIEAQFIEAQIIEAQIIEARTNEENFSDSRQKYVPHRTASRIPFIFNDFTSVDSYLLVSCCLF